MEEFYEGKIFEGDYPPEAAHWCNEGQQFHIEEIEPLDGVTRFQIMANQPWVPNAEEQIALLQMKLQATDYAVIKIAEGAATREEYEDVIAQREEWRAQINALQEQL